MAYFVASLWRQRVGYNWNVPILIYVLTRFLENCRTLSTESSTDDRIDEILRPTERERERERENDAHAYIIDAIDFPPTVIHEFITI